MQTAGQLCSDLLLGQADHTCAAHFQAQISCPTSSSPLDERLPLERFGEVLHQQLGLDQNLELALGDPPE